ncbi:MAG: ABC transporter permease [Sphingomonadales bacterium]|jgi:putative ABC transport system permease protein
MIYNYLKTALRLIAHHKLYALITILSLAIGLSAVMLIKLYLDYENSFDNHWPDKERIFRAHTHFTTPGVDPLYDAWTPYRLKFLLEDEFPQIEAAGLGEAGVGTVRKDGQSFTQPILVAGDGMFDVFTFESIDGHRLAALPDVNSLYLSKSAARKYFGDEDPVGKILEFDTGFTNAFGNFVVRGVFKDFPSNSHLQVEMVRRFNTALVDPANTSWSRFTNFTYFKIHDGATIEEVEARLADVKKKLFKPITNSSGRVIDLERDLNFLFFNVQDLHFDTARGDISGPLTPPKGDAATAKALQFVAIIILVIAAINFVNLTTSRASLRAREVALRKTLGGRRGQIIAQFLFEAVLLAAIAGAVAVLAVKIAMPFYADALGRPLEFNVFGPGDAWAFILALILGLGVLGGLYPAFYLSRFDPADVLRANKSSSGRLSLDLRRILVIAQFAASVALLVSTYFIYAQTEFARSFKRGYDLDNQLILRDIGRFHNPGRVEKSKRARARIAEVPGVESATLSQAMPADDLLRFSRYHRPGIAEDVALERALVDPYFDDVFGLNLIAGRFFEENSERDEYHGIKSLEKGYSVVINAKALDPLGFASAEEAVGQVMKGLVYNPEKDKRVPIDATVIGVVGDVQYGSIRAGVGPTAYEYQPEQLYKYNIAVRFTNTPRPADYERVKAAWDEVAPDFPFDAVYINDELAAHYKVDVQRGRMFAAFSVLTAVIGLIGLFGLSFFTIEQRRKEIAMRRVLGGSIADITNLMSWQFGKLVVIANVIGWPLAYFISKDWIAGFVEQISLSPLPFIAVGLLTLGLAWVCVGAIALRAIKNAPIEALRSE